MTKLFKFRWSVTLALALFLVLAGHPFVEAGPGKSGGGDGRENCPHERAGLPRQDHGGPRQFVYYVVTYPGGQFADGPFATAQEAHQARVKLTERTFRSYEVVLMGEGR